MTPQLQDPAAALTTWAGVSNVMHAEDRTDPLITIIIITIIIIILRVEVMHPAQSHLVDHWCILLPMIQWQSKM